jgi:transcriptional regulator with XRE-family HTH domain
MEQSTMDTVTSMVAKHGSQRKLGALLGVSHGVINNIVNGKHDHVSLATENHVRALLGLTALLPTVEIPACKDCGGAHYGDCGGRQVALRPVRHRKTARRIADYTATQLASAIRNRHPMLDAAT